MIAERLTAQLLAGAPAEDPVEVTRRLLAIQAQDPRGARLAIRARSSTASSAEVDRALTDERSLLITWLNRGTLHLIGSEDYAWLHALTTPPLRTANARRLAQEGVTPRAAERGVAVIERTLAEQGPATRPQLRQALDAGGIRTEGQALIHLLVLASLRGLIVRGPMIGNEQAHVLVSDWLQGGPRFDRDRALAELARRYLAGHGPADDRDLARWSGLGLRDARAGLRAIAHELEQRPDGLLDLLRRQPAAKLPPPRLLGAFDPVLLGWRSREPLLGGHRGLVTVNGLFRPFALVHGRAVATWRLSGAEVSLMPLQALTASQSAELRADARALVRYLGLETITSS
jgi:hypothetical protein